MIPGNPILPAGIHQHLGAQNIGPEEYTGILYGTVNVTLRRKIHHHIRVFLLKKPADTIPVTDISLYKPEVGMFHHRSQCTQITGIRQLVQADNPILRMCFQHMEDKIASDKSSAAGYNDGHKRNLT